MRQVANPNPHPHPHPHPHLSPFTLTLTLNPSPHPNPNQVGPVLAASLETLAMLGRAAPLPEAELEAALELNASLTNAQRVLGTAYPEAVARIITLTLP